MTRPPPPSRDPIVSLTSTARGLAVSGASSNGLVWHRGYKRQRITAFIQSFIPFLQVKRLHAEWEETARSRAQSTATSVRQLCCSRQGLLGQTGLQVESTVRYLLRVTNSRVK